MKGIQERVSKGKSRHVSMVQEVELELEATLLALAARLGGRRLPDMRARADMAGYEFRKRRRIVQEDK